VVTVTQAQLLESIVRFLTEEGRPTDEATIMATARINLEYLQGSPSSFFAPSIAAYKVLLGIVDAPAIPVRNPFCGRTTCPGGGLHAHDPYTDPDLDAPASAAPRRGARR
jgi:hypothetical protein